MRNLFALLLTGLLIATTAFAAKPAHTLSDKEVRVLLEKASTPAQHNQLAQYYSVKADKLEAEANEHAEMAKMYRAQPTASETKRPMSSDTVAHCQSLADSLHKAATEARAMSAAHADMAKK